MSASARNPGPVTVLLDTPSCWGFPGDFLRFLLKKRSISVLWAKRRPKGWGPTTPDATLLSIGVAIAPISHYLVYKTAHTESSNDLRAKVPGLSIRGCHPADFVQRMYLGTSYGLLCRGTGASAAGRIGAVVLLLDQADIHLSLLRSTSSCAVMCLSCLEQ